MTWAILWTSHARRQLDRLGPRDQDRIIAALEDYLATGDGDVRKLSAQDDPTWRLRIGSWRVLFSRIQTESGPALVIVAVANRRDAYRS